VQYTVIALLRRAGIVATVATAAVALTLTSPASPAQAATKAVQIVTVQYDSPGADRGSNQSLNDEWVLIRNTGKKARKITGFTLTDETGYTYTFKKRTLKPGQSVRVRTGKGKDTASNKHWGRGWYVWNNDGDTATLRTAKGSQVDSCTWTGGDQKQSC
jgi:hypothetical protein